MIWAVRFEYKGSRNRGFQRVKANTREAAEEIANKLRKDFPGSFNAVWPALIAEPKNIAEFKLLQNS